MEEGKVRDEDQTRMVQSMRACTNLISQMV